MLQLEQRIGYMPRQELFSSELYGLEKNVAVFYTGDNISMAAVNSAKASMNSGTKEGSTIPYPSGSFVPASNFGLGPGIAKKTDFGFIERYLPPHVDEAHGEHINLGSYLPDKTGKLKEFLNIHIDLNDN